MLSLLLVGLFTTSLRAQSTFGSIRGVVQDTSGASIPDTQVTLHGTDTNTARVVKTDANGAYSLENVLAGKYSIRAQHTGFADAMVTGITLAARQDIRYTLTLPIASQTTTVEVTTSTNQINTENGVIGDQGDAPTTFQGETRYGLADLNRFDIPANKGNVVGTRRDRLLITGTYELPVGRGRQWLNSSSVVDGILGGWNVNTITLLQAGSYETPTDAVGNDRTNTNPGRDFSVVRPDQIGNPTQLGPCSLLTTATPGIRIFNPCAFASAPIGSGRIGDARVGSLEAPGTVAVSAGLAKLIAIQTNWRLRFEATFTNVLNHTNWLPPSTDFSNPTSFGVLTSPQTAENAGNRTGQVALRLEF